MQKLGVKTFYFAGKHPHFCTDLNFDEVRCECLRGLEFIRGLFADGTWDMLILDEINIALRDGFLAEEEILSLLELKPDKLEVILTGRGAIEGLIERADLVSEVREIKHPYDQGIIGREGIEY